MTKENYSNFATTALVTSSINSSALVFTVSSGQGALFPLTNFMITMDTEVMFITSRSADVFTVGIRGFDTSTAASHTAGATIQQCVTAYTMTHLWQNVSDTFRPDVAPGQIGNTPSTYDAEFETGGQPLWTLYPSGGLPSGATFSFGTPLKSHLFLNRGPSDNTHYTAYVPFTMSAPFMVTCKVSHSAPLSNIQSGSYVNLFIADQTNPSGGSSGNRAFMISAVENFIQSSNLWDGTSVLSNNAAHVHFAKDVTSTGTFIGTAVPISAGLPIYMRMTCSVANVYTGYVGDGTTFFLIGSFTSSFSRQTLGVEFTANPQSGPVVQQTAAVDWIRVTTFTGSNGTYGT